MRSDTPSICFAIRALRRFITAFHNIVMIIAGRFGFVKHPGKTKKCCSLFSQATAQILPK